MILKKYGAGRRITAIILGAALILFLAAGLQQVEGVVDADSILPISEVSPGMQGTGKTVVRGAEVEEFQVEVLGILEGGGLAGDLILIEASGDLIERTGGIAAGMSGSPVYVDGRLIGAISYGWSDTDHRVGLVTPIAEMLKMTEYKRGAPGEPAVYYPPEPIEIAGQTIERFQVGDVPREGEPGTAFFTPVAAPLTFSGVRGRALDYLKETLASSWLIPVQGGGHTRNRELEDELKPGSAMAVQLVRGDISISAIGTVTHREGNQIIGFGHPFMNRGFLDLMLSTGYIHHVVKSSQLPFKVGSPGSLVGTVLQDRPAGLSGDVGQYPRIVTLRMEIEDRDLGVTRNFYAQMVPDESLFIQLFSGAALEALDSAIERQGKGMASVEFGIRGRDIPGGTLQRENIFFSHYDVAVVALQEIIDAVQLLLYNPHQELEILDISFRASIEERQKTAEVESIVVRDSEVSPGDTLEIDVVLRPYRSEPVTRTVELEIPESAPTGQMILTAYGGQYYFPETPYPVEEEEEETLGTYHFDRLKDLKDEIKDFVDRPKNNQLLVHLFSPYPPSAYQREEAPAPEPSEEEPEQEPGLPEIPEPPEDPQPESSPFKLSMPEAEDQLPMYPRKDEVEEDWFEVESIIDTEYVLRGSDDLEINIVEPQEEEGEMPPAGNAGESEEKLNTAPDEPNSLRPARGTAPVSDRRN